MVRITRWKKTGRPRLLFEKFGKFLRTEFFVNPKTGQREEFVFVGEANSVGILALTEDKKVVLTKQFKQAGGKILLELPAGVIDKGESALGAARRELEEETGYSSKRIKQIGTFMRSTRSIPSVSYCFLALDCQKIKNPKIDEAEQIEVVVKPFKQWLAEIKRGNTLDCLSVITTLLAEDHMPLSQS